MRTFKTNWLLSALPLSATLLLGGCDAVVLDPKGPIGIAEKTILINSLAIMLAICDPDDRCNLRFRLVVSSLQHKSELPA